MKLQKTLREDMFKARKDGDTSKADILNMIIAALKNAQINKGEELKEEEEIDVIRKEAKKLNDAFVQYTEGGREDLAKKEKEQFDIVETYLPKLMSSDDIEAVVAQVIEKSGANSPRDIGMVMGMVMKELKGKADGGEVNTAVVKLLNK